MTPTAPSCLPCFDACLGCGKFPHRLPPAKKIVKIAFDEFTKDYSLATATEAEIETLTQRLAQNGGQP